MLNNLSQYSIQLASNSPRRRELLAGLGIQYNVATLPEIDESYPETLQGSEIPSYIARQKAQAYSRMMKSDTLLITADTIVWLNGKVYGKPTNEEHAKQMLRELSGQTHTVITGVAITMAVVVLLFGVVNVWWYVGYYRFYQQFAEGHDPKMIYANDLETGQEKSWVLDANEFVWEDETYSYHVQVPEYLQRNGSVDIERLDNSYEGESISLRISQGITGEYTYTVFIDKNGSEDGFEAFMLDPELNQEYLSHWEEEMIAEQEARFIEHRDEVMEIIVAAKEMWKFLK